MANSIYVNGRFIKRAGVYAFIKSGIKNPPLNLSYGNIAIIDSGIGAGWGGGSGVNGEFAQGVESAYEFTKIQDFQAFVKGGELWNLAQGLFKPASGSSGVSKITLIQARETEGAEIEYNLTNGDILLECKDEGLNGNGVLATGNLAKGYGAKLLAGQTANTFILYIYHGTFKGIDPLNNLPYDNIADINAVPDLVIKSPEVANLTELKAWMDSSFELQQGFKHTITISTGAGVIVTADVTNNAGYKLAAGGTETYGSADMDDALVAIKNKDFTFVFCTEYGANATGANNHKILDFITDSSNLYKRYMVVAGGYNKAKFKGSSDASKEIAVHYDNDNVILVHGGLKKVSQTVSGFKVFSQLYHAAAVTGLMCSLEPQTPLTFKKLSMDGLIHVMTDDELVEALDYGIVCTYYDNELEGYVILEGINTLQNNDYLLNEDGTSYNIGVKRISAQLIKEVIVNAKKKFFSNQTQGANRNTVNEADIKAWLEGFLETKCAKADKDNLIISYRNVTVEVSGTAYVINFEFECNFEVNKFIITGTIIG